MFKGKKFEKDVILSVLIRGAGMLISYIYVSLLVRVLGEAKYGLWATIASLLTWMDVCDAGIGNGLRNMLAEALALNREKEAKTLISTAYRILSVLSLVLFSISLLIISIVNWNKILGYEAEDTNLRMLLLTLQIFISLNFVISLCKSVFYALQKAFLVSAIPLLLNLLNCIIIFILRGRITIWILALIYGINMNLVPLVLSTIIYGKNKSLRPSIELFEKESAKKIVNLGVGFFFIQLATWIINQTDNILIASNYGSASVTPFNLINKVFMAVVSISIIAMAPVWSSFTRALAKGEIDWIRKVVYRFNILFIGATIIIVTMGLFMDQIVSVWAGVNINSMAMTVAQCGLFAVLRIWCSFYSMSANGMNLVKENAMLAFFQALINIPLSIFFARVLNFGIIGIILGTNIVMVIGAIYLWIIVNRKIRGVISIKKKL